MANETALTHAMHGVDPGSPRVAQLGSIVKANMSSTDREKLECGDVPAREPVVRSARPLVHPGSPNFPFVA